MTLRRICHRCGRDAIPGGSRCADCAGKSNWDRYTQQHPEKAQFYKSGGWKEARRQQLRLEPNCQECGHPATEVDHIVPLSEGGAPFGPNLQSLCKKHHHEKTIAESHRGRKRSARRRMQSSSRSRGS